MIFHPRLRGRARAAAAVIAAGVLAVTASASVTSYTVRPGETLSAIARKLNVGVSMLVRTNQIPDANRIRAGQSLVVPRTGASRKAAKVLAPAAGRTQNAVAFLLASSVHAVPAGLPPTYVVRLGDRVEGVAKSHGVTVAALSRANQSVTLRPLTVGTVLRLPLAPVWICPVQGPHYWRDDWGAPRPDGIPHEGNDVVAPRGTPVVASVGGALVFRPGRIAGNAYYLHGDDGNTYYGAHLDAMTRGPGRIEAGQQIGVVGDTGNAKGGATHLHFEFHPGGGPPVDPFWALTAWC